MQNNGAFTFNLTPEGDDVVTHEVATALRLEALETGETGPGRSRTPSPKPTDADAKSDEVKPAVQDR